MRYDPRTDRAVSIDEIAAQCRAAILKANVPAADPTRISYDEFMEFACWQDDMLLIAA